VSKRTFSYVDDFAFWRIIGWLRKRHAGLPWKTLRRRYLPGWQPTERGAEMFPTADGYGQPLPLPWRAHPDTVDERSCDGCNVTQWHHCVESRMLGDGHVRCAP